MQSYRDLVVWQKSVLLTKEIYLLTANFPDAERYGLTNQMRRAAVSIPSNIAKGQGRRSAPDFRRFLHIALGSVAELDTQIVIAIELGYLTHENTIKANGLIIEIKKMLYTLIDKLTN
ncbi:MAG: four helix bundle protein [Chloroflexi bacterium]|nr:four helix bundle protein [Chloroflexota bacterium]